MKSVRKLCIAGVVGLATMTGVAKPLILIAATSNVPPVNSAPGAAGYPDPTGPKPGDPLQDRAAQNSTAPATPEASKIRDSEITMKVRAELRAASGLDTSGIKVSTSNGVVHLAGIVKSDSDRLTALNATRSVAGVSTVEDEMKVAR